MATEQARSIARLVDSERRILQDYVAASTEQEVHRYLVAAKQAATQSFIFFSITLVTLVGTGIYWMFFTSEELTSIEQISGLGFLAGMGIFITSLGKLQTSKAKIDLNKARVRAIEMYGEITADREIHVRFEPIPERNRLT